MVKLEGFKKGERYIDTRVVGQASLIVVCLQLTALLFDMMKSFEDTHSFCARPQPLIPNLHIQVIKLKIFFFNNKNK